MQETIQAYPLNITVRAINSERGSSLQAEIRTSRRTFSISGDQVMPLKAGLLAAIQPFVEELLLNAEKAIQRFKE